MSALADLALHWLLLPPHVLGVLVNPSSSLCPRLATPIASAEGGPLPLNPGTPSGPAGYQLSTVPCVHCRLGAVGSWEHYICSSFCHITSHPGFCSAVTVSCHTSVRAPCKRVISPEQLPGKWSSGPLCHLFPLSPSQFPASGVYLPTRGQGPVVGLPGSLRSLV